MSSVRSVAGGNSRFTRAELADSGPLAVTAWHRPLQSEPGLAESLTDAGAVLALPRSAAEWTAFRRAFHRSPRTVGTLQGTYSAARRQAIIDSPYAVMPWTHAGAARLTDAPAAASLSIAMIRRSANPDRFVRFSRCPGSARILDFRLATRRGGLRMDLEGACVHIRKVPAVRLAKHGECEDCVRLGSRWVHLRTCQACGGTRCCDSSPGQHARKHALSAQHPVICSAETGERWLYCFPDDVVTEY